MPRTTTTEYREMAYAQSSGEALITLLTWVHPTITPPIRLALNQEDVTSRGELYRRFDFTIKRPVLLGSGGFSRPSVRLNTVSREMTAAIRELTSVTEITIEQVMASDPDTVALGPWVFEMLGETAYDATYLEAPLVFGPVLTEGIAAFRFDPTTAPALFGPS